MKKDRKRAQHRAATETAASIKGVVINIISLEKNIQSANVTQPSFMSNRNNGNAEFAESVRELKGISF